MVDPKASGLVSFGGYFLARRNKKVGLWEDCRIECEKVVMIEKTSQIDLSIPSLKHEDSMLGMIERLAANPDVDITKMQALLDMRNQEILRMDQQRQIESNRIARQSFNTDYVVMSGELPLVERKKRNIHTGSKYATLEDINEAIRPILSKYGFSITCDITEQTKEIIEVGATLIHRGGHEKSTKLRFPIDSVGMKGEKNKTEIQGASSSITYAKRVAICTLLNISTGEDKDGNEEMSEIVATEIQRVAIMNLCKKLTIEQQRVFDQRTGGLLGIKKKDVDATIAALNNTINKRIKNDHGDI